MESENKVISKLRNITPDLIVNISLSSEFKTTQFFVIWHVFEV